MKKIIKLVNEFLSGIDAIEDTHQFRTLARFNDIGELQELMAFDSSICDIEDGFESYAKNKKDDKPDARVFEINKTSCDGNTNLWFFKDSKYSVYQINLSKKRLKILSKIVMEFDKFNRGLRK